MEEKEGQEEHEYRGHHGNGNSSSPEAAAAAAGGSGHSSPGSADNVAVQFGFQRDGSVVLELKSSPYRPGNPEFNTASFGVQTKREEVSPVFPKVGFTADGLHEVRRKMMEARLRGGTVDAPQSPQPAGRSLVVPLDKGNGETELCTVYVDSSKQRRLPWLGGYHNNRSGMKLLHAAQQTDPTKPPKKAVLMISRETMKPLTKRHLEQGSKDSWTQMDKPGIFLDNSEDYELIPGPYFSAESWVEVRVEAAIIIQKYTRRDIARRTAARMRVFAQERKEFWREEERKRKAEVDDHLRYEIQRRMNPRTGADFEILYTELATWCAQELKKINGSGVAGMDRRKAVMELLFKQIKLLQTIDKLRCKAAKENRKQRISAALEKMSTAKTWEMKNGTIVHVRTVGTARASDLMHLYNALAKVPVGTNDERMGVLGYVKWTVQVFSCPLTREILDLIEREADLMNRGRPARALSSLRQRILHLFLQFIETPDFNPEAAGFQYVPTDFDYGVNQAPTRKPGTDNFT